MNAGVATRLGIVAVTGLAKEARIASGPGVRTIAGGGDARALASALQREFERGARAVISFGIAGGLAEDLASGTWLVPRAIVTADRRWPCNAAWMAVIRERLPGAIALDLAGADAPVTDPAAKRALRRATGAAAVDTESHIAAAIAAVNGVPFAAFRVVADGAQRRLPQGAAQAVLPDGRISPSAVLGSLVRAPGEHPALVRTAVDARRAFRALLRGRRLLGPGLGYPDLGKLQRDMP